MSEGHVGLKGTMNALFRAAKTHRGLRGRKGHGRIETRRYVASTKVDWIASDRRYPGEPRFPGVATLIQVHSTTEQAGNKTTRETRTYISSARSTSTASPPPSEDTGASKVCTGSSMSSSRTISPDTDKGTAQRTWPSFDASLSTSSALTKPREASQLVV